MNEIEERVSSAILNSGMSYYSIAKKLDVSQSVVRRWALLGKISLNNIIPLCELLKIDPNELLLAECDGLELRGVQKTAISMIRQQPKTQDEKIKLIIKILKTDEEK